MSGQAGDEVNRRLACPPLDLPGDRQAECLGRSQANRRDEPGQNLAAECDRTGQALQLSPRNPLGVDRGSQQGGQRAVTLRWGSRLSRRWTGSWWVRDGGVASESPTTTDGLKGAQERVEPRRNRPGSGRHESTVSAAWTLRCVNTAFSHGE